MTKIQDFTVGAVGPNLNAHLIDKPVIENNKKSEAIKVVDSAAKQLQGLLANNLYSFIPLVDATLNDDTEKLKGVYNKLVALSDDLNSSAKDEANNSILVNSMVSVLLYIMDKLFPRQLEISNKQAEERAKLLTTNFETLNQFAAISYDLAQDTYEESIKAAKTEVMASLINGVGSSVMASVDFAGAFTRQPKSLQEIRQEKDTLDVVDDKVKKVTSKYPDFENLESFSKLTPAELNQIKPVLDNAKQGAARFIQEAKDAGEQIKTVKDARVFLEKSKEIKQLVTANGKFDTSKIDAFDSVLSSIPEPKKLQRSILGAITPDQEKVLTEKGILNSDGTLNPIGKDGVILVKSRKFDDNGEILLLDLKKAAANAPKFAAQDTEQEQLTYLSVMAPPDDGTPLSFTVNGKDSAATTQLRNDFSQNYKELIENPKYILQHATNISVLKTSLANGSFIREADGSLRVVELDNDIPTSLKNIFSGYVGTSTQKWMTQVGNAYTAMAPALIQGKNLKIYLDAVKPTFDKLIPPPYVGGGIIDRLEKGRDTVYYALQSMSRFIEGAKTGSAGWQSADASEDRANAQLASDVSKAMMETVQAFFQAAQGSTDGIGSTYRDILTSILEVLDTLFKVMQQTTASTR